MIVDAMCLNSQKVLFQMFQRMGMECRGQYEAIFQRGNVG